MNLKGFLIYFGFVNSRSNASLFIYKSAIVTVRFFVYVNDLIVRRNSAAFTA